MGRSRVRRKAQRVLRCAFIRGKGMDTDLPEATDTALRHLMSMLKLRSEMPPSKPTQPVIDMDMIRRDDQIFREMMARLEKSLN